MTTTTKVHPDDKYCIRCGDEIDWDVVELWTGSGSLCQDCLVEAEDYK